MVDVAGGGHIKVSLEATRGSYQAVLKAIPITSESLREVRTDPLRKVILGQAVTRGKVGGRAGVEGSITMEAMPETMAYFLIASRFGNNLVKAGAGPYTYTAIDDAAAHVKTTLRSLSIGVSRAGIGFAYLGCQATKMRLFFEDGIPMVEYSIFGLEETTDYAPSAVVELTETPFAADDIAITVAGSSRTDIDSLEVSIDDNGSLKYNQSGQEAADYVLYGEHVGEASFEVDFESKADYAIWKARTVQELTAVMTKSANQIINLEFHGGIYDDFTVDLSALGDQVRAAATLRSAYTVADLAATKIILTTQENITIV